MERDDLVEENEKCAARLDQLTSALQDQREEKSRLANQVRPSLALASEEKHRHRLFNFVFFSFHVEETGDGGFDNGLRWV